MARRETGAEMEQRMMAFAEQLGRIAGTVQARAEGWMDREALRKQLSGVRDEAADLLNELAASLNGAVGEAKNTVVKAAPTARRRARSGGVVDAPGKKHRKPAPRDPRVKSGAARRANMRASQASMKTM